MAPLARLFGLVFCGSLAVILWAWPSSQAQELLSPSTADATARSTTGPAGNPESRPASEPAETTEATPDWPSRKIEADVTLGDPRFRHGSEVTHIEVLAQRNQLLTTGNDGTARLWDLATGRLVQAYSHERAYVWDSVVLADGRRMLTCGEEGKIILWDLDSGKRLREFKHDDMVFRIALDKAQKRLAGGDQTGCAAVWDLETGEKIAAFSGSSSIYTLVFDKDDACVIAGLSDSSIRRWDIESKKESFLKAKDDDGKRPSQHSKTGDIFTIVMSADKSRAIICCSQGPWLMDTSNGKEIWRAGKDKTAHSAAWSPDGKNIAAAGGGKLHVLDASDGTTRWSANVGGDSYAVAYHADGKTIFFSSENVVCRFDAETGARLYPAPDEPLQNQSVSSICSVPQANLVLACDGKAGIQVWDEKTKRIRNRFLADQEVQQFDISADGKILLAVLEKTTLALDAQTGAVIRTLSEEGDFEHIRISPDSRWAVLMHGYTQEVQIYNIEGGGLERTISIADDDGSRDYQISHISMGSLMQLAGLSDDKLLRVWHLASGELLHELPVEGQGVGCCFVGENLLHWDKARLHVWSAGRAKAPALSDDEVQKLISQLSADQWAQREDATERLAAVGGDIIPALKAVKSDDPEIKQRVEAIQNMVVKGPQLTLTDSLAIPDPSEAEIIPHPDGRHWLAILRKNSRVLLGEVRDSKLQAICYLDLPHAISSAHFEGGDDLVTGNRNGTITIYRNLLKQAQVNGTITASAPATRQSYELD